MLQQHIDSKLLDRFRGTSFSLVLVELLMFAQSYTYIRFSLLFWNLTIASFIYIIFN